MTRARNLVAVGPAVVPTFRHTDAGADIVLDESACLVCGRESCDGEHHSVDAAAPVSGAVEAPPYSFTAAVSPDHFLGRWIAYASARTDAAHEYHEAAALVLLAG